MNNLGNYIQKFSAFLLSFLFTQELFSYKKIFEIHTKESRKIQGSLRHKEPFLYFLPYCGYTKKLIWSIKFKNNKSACSLLGKLLYEELPEQLIEWSLFENFDNPLAVCVPSSKKSQLKRGFNQNHVIISDFLKRGGSEFVQYQPNVVIKTKNVLAQSRTKTKQERLKNPQGAFAIANAHLPLIKNRNIILFDDVLTTGATTNEIKKLLHKAGASQIKVVVITH